MKLCLFVLLPLISLSATAATVLRVNAPEAANGEVQVLTLELDRAITADAYLLLTGGEGIVKAVKADGTFAAPGRIVPFLLSAKLDGKTEIRTWRLTGLEEGAWVWSLVLTQPGAGLDPTERLGIGKAKFTVKKSEAPLFVELAEGRRGGEPGAAAGFGGAGGADAFGVEGEAPATGSIAPGRMARPKSRLAGREALDFSGPASTPSPLPPPAAAPVLSAPPPATKPAPGGLEAPRRYDVETAKKAPAEAAPAGGAERVEAHREFKGKVAELADDGLALGAKEGKDAKKAIRAAKSLSAGATDDNKAFGDFLTFLTKRNSAAVMCQDVAQRRFITVLDAKGRHVSNADVAIHHGDKLLFAGRTTANGQTLFCPAALPDLKAGKQTVKIEVAKGLLKQRWTADIDVKRDDNLSSRFDPKQLPEQPMPVNIMPLPGCGFDMLRAPEGAAKGKAMAATLDAAPAARRALEAPPMKVDASEIDWLDENFRVELAAADVAVAPAAREKAVPKGDWVLRLPGVLDTEAPRIDLVFQIDTTGSMRDEIRAVQATLQSTAKRIDQMDPKPLVRWGLVLYGDRGDKYVVRRYAFTPDVNELHKWVLNMEMTGGGDTPESALEALHASVNEMAWDTGDAIRLIFLVADAPPHLDYKRPYTYVDKMREATAKGIKIFPTAASGLDKTGEFIFRQWAQATMGKFLYITYGAGGAGGPAGETPHEVAQPKKQNNLDDLIVKTVADELANWRSPTLYESGEPGVEEPKLLK